ncbi:glycerophosphodiester phosphodiesterase [Pseudactinotalea sp.]|uniref:glycerophosphodiester phosphodiesterase n=1 Tax=Pseudactinotalea sp. TaxID=1926260 RepID=UPI003B3BD0C1
MTTASPLVIAHRGNTSTAPPNTMPAVEGAWRVGADALEIDVRLSGDGHAVVIHDDTVDATTDGTGPVAGLAAEAIARLDAGSWFSPVFRGHRVPLLSQVLEHVSTHAGTDLLLELKGDWAVHDAATVVAQLAQAGVTERTIVQSFWPGTLEAMREVAPGVRTGLLVSHRAGEPEDLVATCARLGVMACNPPYAQLEREPELVARWQDAGLQVMVWTLNEPAQWAHAVELEVDAIITDRPDRLLGWLSALRTVRPAPATV